MRLEGTAFVGSGRATVELVTINARGQERPNRLVFYRQETAHGANQLLEYLAPADVAGTKFLTVDDESGETLMWLYLPALGRERRIAGSAAQDSFMGTDFTFEEIGEHRHVQQGLRRRAAGRRDLRGVDGYVLRLVPREAGSKYSAVTSGSGRSTSSPCASSFTTARAAWKRFLINEDLRQRAQGRWQPHLITMRNESTGSRTVIRVLETSDEPVP